MRAKAMEPQGDMRLFLFSTGRIKSFIVARNLDEAHRIFTLEVVAQMNDLRLRELGCIGRVIEYCDGRQVEEYVFPVGDLLEEAILAWKLEAAP